MKKVLIILLLFFCADSFAQMKIGYKNFSSFLSLDGEEEYISATPYNMGGYWSVNKESSVITHSFNDLFKTEKYIVNTTNVVYKDGDPIIQYNCMMIEGGTMDVIIMIAKDQILLLYDTYINDVKCNAMIVYQNVYSY